MRLLGRSLLSLALASSTVAAQGSAVTRRDLADAYLQIDRIAMTRGIPAAQRAAWNRDFDRTTLAFFGGDFARVLRQMHDLTARMLGDSAAASPTRQLLALRLRGAPRVRRAGDDSIAVTLTVMYADSTSRRAREVTVRVLHSDGHEIARRVVTVPADAASGAHVGTSFPASALGFDHGRYAVDATLAGAAVSLRVPLFALPAGADSARAELSAAAARVDANADAQVRASLHARTALLSDTPDEGNSAQFLADPVALADAIAGEIDGIAAGRDPYRRTGDIWRVVHMPSGDVPLRMYVPPQARTGRPLPVVIALHGAGADENMFLEGYGAGRLRSLADSIGFVVLSPLTTAFIRDRGTLDSALALVARAATIDRARVFVIGHSMGGAAAIRIASEPQSPVRRVVVMAGTGTVPAGATLPPTLFIGAETDLVIPVTRVRVTYDQLLSAGAPVEFEQADGWGHTLMVGAHLDRALRWLLQR